MKRLRVGINGFGRIGRAFTRISLHEDIFDIVAVNTRKSTSEMLAYLLQYDSVYRRYEKEITHDKDHIIIDNKKISTSNIDDPSQIPWEDVDVVVDATGAFKTRDDLNKHIHGSVKKVVLTAPTKDETIPTVVLGVNDSRIDWQKETIFSNASCTTNCGAPLFKILNDTFTVLTGFLTTAHAYTQSQSLVDDGNKTFDRSRAAGINIIPSTTGAARAIVLAVPELKGKIDGMSIRVPVPTVSFTDITAVVQKPTTPEEVNELFKRASENDYKRILGYEKTMLVSSDYIGSPYSAIFDANYTKVMNGHLIKVFSWYDNEWGYSTRLFDIVSKLTEYC